MAAGCAACPCSPRPRSSRAAPAGPASPHPTPRGTSSSCATPATAWCASRPAARAATATRATSSPTARRRPASAIASTRSPSSSRRAGSPYPTSWVAARASPRPDLRRHPIPPGLSLQSVWAILTRPGRAGTGAPAGRPGRHHGRRHHLRLAGARDQPPAELWFPPGDSLAGSLTPVAGRAGATGMAGQATWTSRQDHGVLPARTGATARPPRPSPPSGAKWPSIRRWSAPAGSTASRPRRRKAACTAAGSPRDRGPVQERARQHGLVG